MGELASRNFGGVRLFWLFLLFFTLRFVSALLLDAVAHVVYEVDVYALAAREILLGNGFTIQGVALTWRSPLYSVLLALVFGIAGESVLAIIVVHALFDAGTALLVFWIGQHVFNRHVGLLAGFLYILYPISVYYSLRYLPESFFTFVLLASLAMLYSALQSGGGGRYLVAGALIGVTALIKPVTMLLAPCLALLVLFLGRKKPVSAVMQAGAILLAFVLVIIPWTTRNYLVTGHFVPVATGGGYVLWLGNRQASQGLESHELADLDTLRGYLDAQIEVLSGVYGGEENVPYVHTLDSETEGLPVIEGQKAWLPVNIGYDDDKAFREAALKEMSANPLAATVLLVKKFGRFWFNVYSVDKQWMQIFVYAVQGALLLFALIGVFLSLSQFSRIAILLLVIAYFSGIHTLTFSTLRYSVPLLPLLFLFVSLALYRWGERLDLFPANWRASK